MIIIVIGMKFHGKLPNISSSISHTSSTNKMIRRRVAFLMHLLCIPGHTLHSLSRIRKNLINLQLPVMISKLPLPCHC